jgi:uncharacterized protein
MDALRFALTLAAELIPLFLLIGTLVYLTVETVTPERIRAVLGGRSRWLGVPLAAGLGALTPFCSCSTVPMVNGMKSAGIPVASLIAFLIASPLINPIAVALLGAAVGVQYAALYAVSGILFAILAGVVVERWYGLALDEASPATAAATDASACASSACSPPRFAGPMLALVEMRSGGGPATLRMPGVGSCCAAVPTQGIVATPVGLLLRNAFSRALADLKKLRVALALAIAVGAVIHGYVPADLLARIAGPEQPWAVPAAALLGVPVYASVVVLLPLGTSLLAKGVGIGAVTAFLMGASGFSLPEGIMLSKILPRALLLRVLAVFCLGLVLIGYAFHWLAV